MKVLFYFGHPSQYLFLRNTIRQLRSEHIGCDILIKSKDVLEKLLIEDNESYHNLLPEGRKSSRIGLFIGLLKRDLRLYRYVWRKEYNLFVGSDPSIAHVGFLKRIPVITVLEDDIHIIPDLARLTFPFTSLILTPKECSTGKFENKTIHYNGYMKLAYLHPKWFKKDESFLPQPYFLIRVSMLDAYHDNNIRGLTSELISKIILILKKQGDIYISSERDLDENFKMYELKVNVNRMHHILANASLLISDSQSMTMEAAMLGVPSIRFSDFVGKINVLESLEHYYGLTFGIATSSPELLLTKLNELLKNNHLEQEFTSYKEKMLSEKIDVTSFFTWFILNFPGSMTLMKENPQHDLIFR